MAKRFHELSQRSQAAVFGLLCLLTVVGAWQILLGPARVELESRRARLVAVEGDVAQALATAARLSAYQREIVELEASLDETTAVIPEEKDPQDVLRHLHQLASESSLSLASWKPQDVVTRPQYSEWPITLGFEGGFHDLGLFFERVASMSRLISVSELNIKAAGTTGAQGSVTASCVATTFVFRPSADLEVAAAGTATGGRP